MSTERFARRRRSERLRLARRVVLALSATVAVGALVWVVWFSSWLAVSSVEVEGTSALDPAEVEAAAQVPQGRPLARVDVTGVEERVRALPLVESVDVGRSWPRTITVEVVERTAVAWIMADGAIRGVDRFGAVFRDYPEPPPVTAVEVSTDDPRRRQQALESLGSVLAELRSADPGLVGQIASASAESQDSVTFRLVDGRTVRWGSAEAGEDKLTVLTALLASVQASEYDVSAPEQPTTRG